ncbi:hypothetical protein B566_EDAN015241 [Ephemera danica]|nr:hypothetical protein B566_EDAN015241 [Ephemera danica]
MLEKFGAGESVLGFVRNSNTGYFAITYALYKIATPARYTVTLGGTTLSINYLKRWGYIKPMPTKTQLKEMFEERRDNFKDNLREKKESFFKSRHKD